MNLEERKEKIDLTYKQILIIAVAFIGIVFLYYLIAYFIVDKYISKSAINLTFLNTLKNALLILSIAELIIASYLKKLILSKENKSIETACQNYLTANIVSMACCEAVALYGLLVVFLSKDISHFLPFIVISLIGFSIYFPKKRELEDILIKLGI